MNRTLHASVSIVTLLWAGLAHGQDASRVEAGADGGVPVVDASADRFQLEADAGADADVDAADAGAQTVVADAGDGDADAGKVWASCIEFIPEGVTRPKLTNKFPSRGLAGYALPLEIQVEHGLGEKALPNGFQIQTESDAARALATAGFILPDPDGGSGPSMTRKEVGGKAVTEVLIHFLALPETPGRHELTLPPIPIAISRASGELITLCTTPHTVVIDEPIANENDPKPEPNPPPRPQREVWTLARDLTYGVLLGALVAAVVAWLIVWWRRRPTPPVPPPPPRPPWEVAFESLDAIRAENLIAQAKRSEHMDRVSDVVRIYLGARFGFDGIESTTDEVLQALRRMTPPLLVYDEVRRLLQESDLVKFARWSPTDSDCEAVLVTAARIVRATMPVSAGPRPEAAGEASASASEQVDEAETAGEKGGERDGSDKEEPG